MWGLVVLRLGGNRPFRCGVRVVSWEGVPETEAEAQVRGLLHAGRGVWRGRHMYRTEGTATV